LAADPAGKARAGPSRLASPDTARPAQRAGQPQNTPAPTQKLYNIMCTVTYLPLGKDQFVLTSNRDESPRRQPEGIFKNEERGLIYPKEPSQGGTWIAASDNGRLLCLLNGAFVKHKHQPPYKRSRGLLVLDFFDYKDAPSFFENYDFEGIEPFTLVIYDRGNLYQLRWDEKKVHVKELMPTEAYIWSSATLYPAPIQEQRAGWFTDWKCQQGSYRPESAWQFHQEGGKGDIENGLVMYRNDGIVQTVSHTQVTLERDHFKMRYYDRLSQEEYLAEQATQL